MTNTTSATTKEIAPFLRSLRRMLDTEHASIVSWTPDGVAFEIRDLALLTKDVLPKYFKHAKYSSFQRQLNYFHFRKWTRSKTAVCTFSNPHFQRDAPDLTWQITRKKSVAGPVAIPKTSLTIVVPKMTSPPPRAVDADAFDGLKSPTDATAMVHHHQQHRHLHQPLYHSPMPHPMYEEPAMLDWSYQFGALEDLPEDMNTSSLDWIDSLYSSLEAPSRFSMM